jgi:hypothetical protein
MDGVIDRVRALVAQATAQPGVPVTIPEDLTEQLRANLAAGSRDAILEIRQRERRPTGVDRDADGNPWRWPSWSTPGVAGGNK